MVIFSLSLKHAESSSLLPPSWWEAVELPIDSQKELWLLALHSSALKNQSVYFWGLHQVVFLKLNYVPFSHILGGRVSKVGRRRRRRRRRRTTTIPHRGAGKERQEWRKEPGKVLTQKRSELSRKKEWSSVSDGARNERTMFERCKIMGSAEMKAIRSGAFFKPMPWGVHGIKEERFIQKKLNLFRYQWESAKRERLKIQKGEWIKQGSWDVEDWDRCWVQ